MDPGGILSLWQPPVVHASSSEELCQPGKPSDWKDRLDEDSARSIHTSLTFIARDKVKFLLFVGCLFI